jgi:hypothetical protein
MKKEINIKDLVWIHIGERKLSKGRVVEIIDLEDIYEVRTFDTISLDPRGPINLFKKQDTHLEQRFLKKVGMIMPNAEGVIPADDYVEGADLEEPTPEQIHAAMERSQLSVQHEPLSAVKKPKKFYAKRTKKS